MMRRMASYLAIHGVMAALEERLRRRFPQELSGAPVNGKVSLLGSEDFRKPRTTPTVGLYLHRIEIDDANTKRWRAPAVGELGGPTPELPVELHFLLVSWAPSGLHEAQLHAWAFAELAEGTPLRAVDLTPHDSAWREEEAAHLHAAALSTEDLFRIWDALPGKYTLSSSWRVQGVRVGLRPLPPAVPVQTRLFVMGDPSEARS